MVQLTQISNFAVRPHVWLTFSWGNIGSTFTSDSANERYCLSQEIPGVRNIGCGGTRGLNLPLNRHIDIIYILGYTLFEEPCDYLMNVMQLRCEKNDMILSAEPTNEAKANTK